MHEGFLNDNQDMVSTYDLIPNQILSIFVAALLPGFVFYSLEMQVI
jgi:hypothetical protein